MRDFEGDQPRPWLSVGYLGTPAGMADVTGAVTVRVRANRSMCHVAAGKAAVNVTVAVNCTTVGS